MATFDVILLLGFEQRPSRDEQAYLGELGVQVQPEGIADLQVSVQVDAPDVVAALGQAKDMTDRLGGDVLTARVAKSGIEIRPGSLWDRWRRRTR